MNKRTEILDAMRRAEKRGKALIDRNEIDIVTVRTYVSALKGNFPSTVKFKVRKDSLDTIIECTTLMAPAKKKTITERQKADLMQRISELIDEFFSVEDLPAKDSNEEDLV
jgi:hypothetical protein